MSRRRKNAREHDVTERYLAGDDFDQDTPKEEPRYSKRAKSAEQEKILRTAAMRAGAESETSADVESLPIGEVTQVYSLFCEVLHEGAVWLCTTRKTVTKVRDAGIVVGDRVRFREGGTKDELGRPEGVIEQVLPRRTVLTRADSFKGIGQHPIVANADQMLIVASLAYPKVKWGLIDRMLIAAKSGGLAPIICLNKLDWKTQEPKEYKFAEAALAHYATLQVTTIETSVEERTGLDRVRDVLRNQVTVLAGHSGVGKSSLVQAIQPHLDIRIAAVSAYTEKGRHTTTSARRYPLDFGGAVVDTPGVKQFGLWNVTRDNLLSHFPDVEAGAAPKWRMDSYARIEASLREGE